MRATVLICTLLAAPAVLAWGECAHERKIDQVLDLAGSEELAILAAAGDLEVRGGDGEQAVIRGRLCVSEEAWLDEARVVTSSGKRAEIAVELPETSGWSLTGGRYAWLDLDIRVPAGIALDVSDSSGDVEIEGVAAVRVADSSGDIELRDIGGPVFVKDSSGDVELWDIRGDVTVENDSSGDLDGERITGNVLVEKDSSGDIRFEGVSGNVTVERDSSGDIVARDIGGDVTVLRDGSGEIRTANVSGKVTKPEKS